jgi:hypothetical protein
MSVAGENKIRPKGKEIMNQDNRVLGRKGARELMAKEVEDVRAGITIHTNTACFVNSRGQAFALDSSPFECGTNGDNPL